MMVFSSMLVGPAEAAGMKVPTAAELKADKWEARDYPHFTCFCNLQLCRPMKMDGEQWRNAKVIAEIPEERLITMTLDDFLAAGLEWQQ